MWQEHYIFIKKMTQQVQSDWGDFSKEHNRKNCRPMWTTARRGTHRPALIGAMHIRFDTTLTNNANYAPPSEFGSCFSGSNDVSIPPGDDCFMLMRLDLALAPGPKSNVVTHNSG